ncbi:hypothetical protein ABVT39_008701 [Epinephelus coioides]
MKGDVALQNLPCLLPGSSYKVAKNSTRPTLDEAKTYFIDKKPIGTNMPEYLRQAGKTRPEPFILVLGQDNAISQVFFVFNGRVSAMRLSRLSAFQTSDVIDDVRSLAAQLYHETGSGSGSDLGVRSAQK